MGDKPLGQVQNDLTAYTLQAKYNLIIMTIDDRYQIISQLNGAVYKVQDIFTNAILALKLCKSQKPEEIMELKNEFFTLANLNHPNIVKVHDLKKAADGYYFTMEFIEGDNIFDYFMKRKDDFQSLYAVIGEVLQALHYVHQKGLIHGDIKPQNIIIHEGRAKLLDFGLARVVGTSSKKAGGTLAYIAPELFKGGKIDPRVDLYSLGVVLYEILKGEKIQSLDEEILPKSMSVPKVLRNMVIKLTKRDPDQRHSSVKEVWEDLLQYLPQIQLEFTPSVLTSRIIGRDSEISELQKFYSNSTKRGKIVLIVGERGIGKSRILREFSYRCQMDECNVVHLACPKGGKEPLLLIKNIFKEAGERVDDRLDVPDDFSQERTQLKLFEELTKIFVKLSKRRGRLVLIVDELDCADPLSIEFLAYFSPEIIDRAIFLVGAVEDETKLTPIFEKAQGTDLLSKIGLKRLNLEDTRAMISSMLSTSSIDDIAEWIYERAGGNPLHIEKTLEYLIKIGCIYRFGDRWVLNRVKAEQVKPTASLSSLVDLSLKPYEPEELKMLQYASVIGNFFDASLLQRLLSYDDRHFYPILLKLRYSDAIKEIRGTEYGFSHGWMREVLYGRISPSQRKDLHLKAFQILKEAGSSPETLFYHAFNSGLDQDAYEYAIKAGENAERTFAPYNALEYYEKAFKLSRKLKKREGPFLYERLGDIQHLIGSYDEALKNYNRALELSHSTQELYLKIGKLHRDRGDYPKAIDCFRKIPASKSQEYLQALNQRAWTCIQANQTEEALQTALKAKELAEELDDYSSLSDSYHNLAQIALREKNHEEAVRHFQSSLRIKEKIGDSYGIAAIQNNLAILHWNRGEIAKAEHYYINSLKLMEKLGDVKAITSIYNNLGIIYRQKREWEKALAHYEKSYQIYRKIGDKKSLVAVYNNLAVAYYHRGKWIKAVEFYRKSLTLCEEMDMQPELATTMQNLGSILLDKGNLEEAHELLKRSLDLRNRLGDEVGATRVLIEIGRYWIERGIWKRALQTLKQSLNQLDRGNEQDIAKICSLQALVYLKTHRFRLAQSKLSKAEKYFQKMTDLDGLGSVERLKGILYSLRRESDRAVDCFKKSEKIFKEIDKEYEIGLTLLEMAHHNLRNWKRERNFGSMQNALVDLKEAEEIFAHLEANGKLEEAHRTSVEVLDLISRSFLPAYSRLNQLNTLYEISKLINSILDLNLLFNTTMELVIELLNAERGVLLLLDPNTRKLEVASGKKMDKETIRDVTKLSNSIIARVTKKGEPIICMDALSDSRFKNRKSVILHKIRSLLCVPLKTNEKVLGTIYVDSRLSDNMFGEQDKDFLVALANLIAVAIERARLHRKLEKETVSLKREVVKRYTFQGLVGKNEKMQEIYNLVEKVSRTDSTVLITGESGTGKDLVARAIHLLSNRRDNQFVTVQCTSIPENLLESELFGHTKGAFTGAIGNKKGLFEEADGGTIFLNEIGDAPPAVQAKLLRVLETGEIRRIGETRCRKVNVRVICATNRDLKKRIEEDRFREDLYYRLNVVNIHLPPLRQRRDDIPIIADHFRRLYSKMLNKEIKRFSKKIVDFLCRQDWPGNVRQLENCIARACAISEGEEITVEDLRIEEETTDKAVGLREAREFFQMNKIKQALQRCGGNRTRAAELLGIKRQQLQRYIKKYKISVPSQNKKVTATN